MLYRKWHSEQLNTDTVEELKRTLGISSLLAKVLANKGVNTPEKARKIEILEANQCPLRWSEKRT